MRADDDELPDFFPSLDRSVCYINAAGRSPLPERSLVAGLAAVAKKANHPWDVGDTEAIKDEIRELFASLLIGADANDIATAPSCSHAISLAAHNLRSRLRERTPGARQVLVLHDQMPSNVLAWQALCEDEAGELLVVPRPPRGRSWADAIVERVAGGTVAVVAVAPCHWTDGAIVDLAPVGRACRAAGAHLVVDATQYLGAAPALDVRGIGISFLACSVHKWLLGPYGVCLCYAAPEFWRDARAIDHHDRNREGAQHVDCLPMDPRTGFVTAFQPGARRLDSGGRPSFILLPILAASLRLLVHEIRIPRLVRHLSALTAEVASRAVALGFEVPERHAPGIVGLRPAPWMPSSTALVAALARQPRKVLVSDRLGSIRVSPHLYNTRGDVEQLISGLADAVGREPARAPRPRL
jgi:selenocysteine lyase/cysteine desulfurase